MTTIVTEYNGFKLGDKVRISSGSGILSGGFYSHNVGKTGIIAEFDPGATLDVKVEGINEGMYDWGRMTEIVLVQEEPETGSILQRLAALEKEIAAIKTLIG